MTDSITIRGGPQNRFPCTYWCGAVGASSGSVAMTHSVICMVLVYRFSVGCSAVVGIGVRLTCALAV